MINVSRLAGRWGLVGLWLAFCWLASGCKTADSDSKLGGAAEPGGAQFASVSPAGLTNNATNDLALDALHVGDKITVEFSDTAVSFPPRDERIKEDGTITLLEGKTFVAAGKTRGQLENEIHDCYVPKYYLKMTVSVQQQKETQFYYVRGEVRIPGRQVYISRITTLRAIGSSGDFTDFARKTAVQVIRANGQKITINAKKALRDSSLDVEIFPGDTVYVPRRGPLW
jgi:protein involved in polysaccharide export with SLBB domain